MDNSKNKPMETNNRVINKKNKIPDPNIRRARDAVLVLFRKFSSAKKPRIDGSDPFGMCMEHQILV